MNRNLLGATCTALQNGSSESQETCTPGDINTVKILDKLSQIPWPRGRKLSAQRVSAITEFIHGSFS